MHPKKLKQLKKHLKSSTSAKTSYITQMQHYREVFKDDPQILILINNVLEADRLLAAGLAPQPLPVLQVPDDFQDQLFKRINEQYAMGDPRGDAAWNTLSAALPKVDQLLRDFRDYIEDQYGMWAYISAPFLKDLADNLGNGPVLEVMAGNGYISKGLKRLHPTQTVITTDSKAWTKENGNQTGKQPVTAIETLDAVNAFQKYAADLDYVIMAWSPDKLTIDWDLLQAMRASEVDVPLICIGEKYGATGSKAFWDHAEYQDGPLVEKLNAHYRPFDLIHDQVYVIK
ncbi:SAM-dependent methyltransferase [Lactiplantibacillus mudanjiangensis]|uniref:SAM-dependent methyltransferase [Lactobacillus sp.] n=1 Tax=Lactiplantibacillus mudanjiangensis TaxID=1296538 RepID=A0A660DWJ9_9LACO|nr:SAM-dependent methyltransferase [Lactiplantibacillus mudanjiangensis]VDG18946.1 SAM-dependent methyltransferase [Lactobacillus sp.] [Lactiplantibacillus mudanjiangensis]VDG25277.1 SAM-dependent methyltransferase [Lactobacillus sp.] [Lactiplantibacillus mudanjiangensis]VDG27470.1 SAM-dependent methyltransferase [Lactobacillus sp.] [Lactiplantibacillus mudanjiangensis]VDG33047.1 SAM-dependent methyltransferase [Lactobacillus sp.] [Lactiplantibacillus mudanjiangensis]